jgi:undecaprenyl-diphosphatase
MIYLSFFIIILGFLTYFVYTQNSFFSNLDEKVLDFFHSLQSRTLDILYETITWLGSLWVLFPLYLALSFYLLSLGYKNLVLSISIGFGGAVATTYFIKYILERKRPELFEVIGDMPIDPSFPSAHTTQVFIFAFLTSFVIYELGFDNRYLFIGMLLLTACLVASSRMYLQVHYFTDVLAGITIASIWVYVAIYIFRAKGGL